MRIRFMFHTLIIFTIALTFSAPFVTLAQQNHKQIAATKDANALKLEVKLAAEQDASNDLNKNSGLHASGFALAGGLIGALVGCLVGSIFPRYVRLFFNRSGYTQ